MKNRRLTPARILKRERTNLCQLLLIRHRLVRPGSGLSRSRDRLVLRDYLMRLAVGNNLAALKQNNAVAQTLDRTQIMRDKDDGRPRLFHLAYALQAFLLKGCVANGQDFIQKKNVRV